MDFDLNDEQKAWKNSVHKFVEEVVKPKAREVDENEEFNWDAVRKGGPVGLLGLNIPEEYGGSNVDMVSCVVAMEEIGWGCGSTALSFTSAPSASTLSFRPVHGFSIRHGTPFSLLIATSPRTPAAP